MKSAGSCINEYRHMSTETSSSDEVKEGSRMSRQWRLETNTNRFGMLAILLLAMLVMGVVAAADSADAEKKSSLRRLQASEYWSTKNLGSRNYDVTIGNPMRGLASNPAIRDPQQAGVEFSLEAYYFPFNGVVTGRDVRTGAWQYNWTSFDSVLDDVVTSHSAQSIPRFYIMYPNQPLALPPYLQSNVKMAYDAGLGQYPLFNDATLLSALQDFIRTFGRLYDGDKRIAFIQTGLMGAWGEWHCGSADCKIEEVVEDVERWWSEAFPKTKVQLRYPQKGSATYKNIGYHDDSFTWATLDGPHNGGVLRNMFFWNNLRNNGLQDSWKTSVTGGEIRPENGKIVFKNNYPANKEFKQDFMACVETVHATYMKSSYIFRIPETDEERVNARRATARMGYAFELKQVGAARGTTPGTVDISVTIEQIGVAPFYYGLALQLTCADLPWNQPRRNWGIQRLVDRDSSNTYVFQAVPATASCLRSVRLSLESDMVYSPIKLAQANGTVFVNIPLPPAGVAPTPVTPRLPAPAPVAPVTPPPPAIIYLQLINTDTDKAIRTGGIRDGYVISHETVGTTNLSLRAIIKNVPRGMVLEVSFAYFLNNNKVSVVERTAPYDMGGSDATGNLRPSAYLSTPGSKTVTVTATNVATGLTLVTRSVTFSVVSTSASSGAAPVRRPSSLRRFKLAPRNTEESQQIQLDHHQ